MSDILNGDFPEPLRRQEEYLQAIIKNQKSGSSGKDGTTFIPSVSSEGVISWTNDGELENPSPVNIKGPKGDTGAAGKDGAAGAQGPKGDTGATGAKGDKGDAGAAVSAISLQKDSTGAITGGTATLNDGSTIAIAIEVVE